MSYMHACMVCFFKIFGFSEIYDYYHILVFGAARLTLGFVIFYVKLYYFLIYFLQIILTVAYSLTEMYDYYNILVFGASRLTLGLFLIIFHSALAVFLVNDFRLSGKSTGKSLGYQLKK